MSWVPAEQVLQAVAAQKAIVADEQRRVDVFAQQHLAERAKLEAERSAAAHDLAQAVLPSLDPIVIATAAETVGMTGLPSENIPAKIIARRAFLVQRIRAIEADPRYANLELYRHPRTGSLTRELAEAEEMRKPAADVLATCEAHPRFDGMFASGFGTPEFSAPWWRYSYWEDRSAAASLATAMGKASFAEVVEAYQSAAATRATFDAEILRLRGEIAACDALAHDHTTLTDEHTHLDARALAHTQKRVVDFLLGTDASLVSQRLSASPAVRLLFLRASGIAAKLTYLDGVERKHVAEMHAELKTQAARLGTVEFRTRRRWAAMPLDKYQKLAEDRRPRYEKRWQRFGKVYNSVYVYDRWDRGRYYDDLLWWDLMTRGRYDGSYMPEVYGFHQRHPDYRFDPDYKSRVADIDAREEAEAEAAAAAIDADSVRDGGGSDWDKDTGSVDAS